MKESLKHEIKASQEGVSEEQRQYELKEKSRTAIQDLREQLERNFEKNSTRKKDRISNLIE